MKKDSFTMAKLMNGWEYYSDTKFATLHFFGRISKVNIKSDVPIVCKMAMHKGFKGYLNQVQVSFTAGELLYAAPQSKSGWKQLF